MEHTVSPAELVWSGEVRLAILVPEPWTDAQQEDLDALLNRVSSQLAEVLLNALPRDCDVAASVA